MALEGMGPLRETRPRAEKRLQAGWALLMTASCQRCWPGKPRVLVGGVTLASHSQKSQLTPSPRMIQHQST